MRAAVRPVRDGDAPAIAAIYAPYVTDTVVTFEETPPDAAEIARRIAGTVPGRPWLVAEANGGIVGYAYAGPLNRRPAYRRACETTIYLARGERGRGTGRLLYAALFDALTARGFVTAIGIVSVPNDESVRFHEAMGFVEAGRLQGVGWKHGAWRDVGYFQRDLAPREPGAAGTTPGGAG